MAKQKKAKKFTWDASPAWKIIITDLEDGILSLDALYEKVLVYSKR
jgi:hypothetical protein